MCVCVIYERKLVNSCQKIELSGRVCKIMQNLSSIPELTMPRNTYVVMCHMVT